MADRELMQQALDALETKGEHHPRVYQAIAALRERLAQPEDWTSGFVRRAAPGALRERLAQPEDWQYVQKLNSFSYPRPWVGLTKEDVYSLFNKMIAQEGNNIDTRYQDFAKYLEAKLKEKNT